MGEQELTEAQLADLARLFEANTDPKATERLMNYWAHGDGAAKIRWGSAGDFDRCVSHLGKYVADAKGLCSNLHVRATGARPGKAPSEQESAVTEPTTLIERAPITAAPDKATGRGTIQVITPGWGSSGYYSPKVLAEAAKKRVFPKGTKMYADHPTTSEAAERPERSIKDIVAVLTEDARLDAAGGLVAGIEVLPQFRESLSALAKHDAVGCSIRADGTLEEGEADGRRGRIITELTEGHSVDFVTAAGRGGKILVLESDRIAVQEEDGTIREAMANDTQSLLNDAIQTTYGRKSGLGYAYVCDYDPDQGLVYFEARGDNDAQATWRQSYSIDGRTVTLSGDRAQVRRVTNYVPVLPAGQTESQPPQEIPMGQISIEESEHTRLTEAAGRVTALEAERDTLKAENATLKARDQVRPIVAKVLAESTTLPASTKTRLVDQVVTAYAPAGDGTVDEAKVKEAAEKARKDAETEIAEALQAAGVGGVSGMGGGNGQGGTLTEADKEARVARIFNHDQKAS